MDDNITKMLFGDNPYDLTNKQHILVSNQLLTQWIKTESLPQENPLSGNNGIANFINEGDLQSAFNKTLKGGMVHEHYESISESIRLNNTHPFEYIRNTLSPKELVYYDYIFPVVCQVIRHSVKHGKYTTVRLASDGIVVTLVTPG